MTERDERKAAQGIVGHHNATGRGVYWRSNFLGHAGRKQNIYTTGYFVTLSKHFNRQIEGRYITVDQVLEFLAGIKPHESQLVGSWHDTQTDTTHLDAVCWFSEGQYPQALAHARKIGEPTVWSVKRGKAVRV
jgi:hypothetical protein